MSEISRLDLSEFAEVRSLLGPAPQLEPQPFLAVAVSPAAIAATLKLAFPAAVEYRGRVFRASAFEPANIDRWFTQLGDPVAVERVVNHVHLWDVMADSEDVDREAQLLLAPLAQCWTAALCLALPDRELTVLATPDGGYGPELTFHS